jgi:hypothetical protein
MIFKDIAIVNVLTEDVWLKLKKRLVKKIICINITAKIIPSDIEIITARLYKVDGEWYSHRQNKRWLEKMPPQFYKSSIILYKNVLLKLLFWSNSYAGRLIVGGNDLGADLNEKQVLKYLYPSSALKALLKSFYLKYSSLKNQSESKPQEILASKWVFAFYSEADLTIWKNLIRQFKPSEVVIVRLPDAIDSSNTALNKLESEGYVFFDAQEIPVTNHYNPKFVCTINRAKANIQLAVFNNLPSINQYISLSRLLIASASKGVIINAGENRFQSHVIEAEFKASKKPIFNTMNGIKFNTANNAGTNFTKWFVPDEGTKQELLKAGASEQELCIKGHLMEDDARNHRFSNLLQYDLAFYRTKKVMLICTSGHKERRDLLAYLPQFVSKGYYVLWKDHPSTSEEIAQSDTVEVMPNDFNKNRLYDALTVASVLIVSGSTVALEAQWFHVPTISYEIGDSLLYLVREGKIVHVKSIQELDASLLAIKRYAKYESSTKNVAELYKEEILRNEQLNG